MGSRFAAAALCAGLLALSLTGLASEARAQARSCKAVSSCAEAVELWCSGYSRADRDGDGVPCEGRCLSKAQADEIRAGRSC